MQKYKKQLIMDYIFGNEITDYNTEELENDPNFMIEVINLTSDEKMYRLCSEDLKHNYNFVVFLMNKFEKNIDFLCNVVDEYLKEPENDVYRFEIVIRICTLTEKIKDDSKSLKYKLLRNTIYLAKKLEVDMALESIDNDPNLRNELGLGYFILFDEFNYSPIVTNYLATQYIKEIFEDKDINLEKLAHKQFKKVEDIDKIGVNNYLINIINLYDQALASYVSAHIELLNDYKIKLEKIKKDWHLFAEKVEKEQIRTIIDFISSYVNANEIECGFIEEDAFQHFGKLFGIEDKIKKYDKYQLPPELIDDYEFESGDYEEDIDFINPSTMSFIARKHYEKIKDVITRILAGENVEDEFVDTYTYDAPKYQNENTIINIDFGKNNYNNHYKY